MARPRTLAKKTWQESGRAAIFAWTITLPADMAAAVKDAVGDGDYASSSEVVREALRDWKHKRALQHRELVTLKADIGRGLKDIANGRVKDFDVARIAKRGKTLLRGRSRSA